MAKKKINPNERLIHISAESELMSVYEVVPESRAEKRLIDIREGFIKMKNRSYKYGHLKMKVTTGVHNPTLF